MKAGLVAGEQAERVGIVRERFPGVGGAGCFVNGGVFLFEFRLDAAHFVIEEGELPADVAVRLEREGLVENGDAFLLLLKFR